MMLHRENHRRLKVVQASRFSKCTSEPLFEKADVAPAIRKSEMQKTHRLSRLGRIPSVSRQEPGRAYASPSRVEPRMLCVSVVMDGDAFFVVLRLKCKEGECLHGCAVKTKT